MNPDTFIFICLMAEAIVAFVVVLALALWVGVRSSDVAD
jgi:hypothetical protein